MKANELQIGDYVNYRGQIIKVTSLYDKGGSNEVGWSDKESVWVNADNVEPIPLTPEILEKNGFEKVYDKYKLPNYRIKWNSYTDLYFTVFTGVDGYWNPIGLNVITGGLPATVDYVHQLQHALRFCGIRKEIVL